MQSWDHRMTARELKGMQQAVEQNLNRQMRCDTKLRIERGARRVPDSTSAEQVSGRENRATNAHRYGETDKSSY